MILSDSSKLSNKGWVIEQPWGRVFFGNRKFVPHEDLSSAENGCFLEQVHGNKVVEGLPKTSSRADGQWTQEPGRPLFIKTADCLPVFLFDPVEKRAYGLHIGWRGLSSKILSTALKGHQRPGQVQMWIGPHIHKEDFFLNPSNLQILAKQHPYIQNFIQPSQIAPNQYSVNLAGILVKEASALGIPTNGIWTAETSTYRSSEHHSHRRFSGNKGRQYAFIELRS